ncbi:hypothetical protein SLS53_004144 [Cytospora paraplurivora]|uniref:SUR7 protein n=1 Tax=Cytospora paraplurivora TaxID=2898453 RepID=A0AAN9UGD9_9PEZI
MGIGRVFCVALPFALTVASLIALLVAGLAGVTDKSLYLFKVNTTDLSISPSSIESALSSRSLYDRSDLSEAAEAAAGTNVTGADLGLSDGYYVNIWNYCQTVSTGGKQCKKAQINWAKNATKSFEDEVSSVSSAMGENITLPSAIKEAMTTFSTVTYWTEIVFLIAYVSLAASLFVGIFANCSRAFSCCTSIISSFASLAVCAAAALATVTAAVVIGALDGTAKKYGVTGTINTRFLATVWISAAFAIAAGFFWLFTICCCKPDHSRSRGKAGGFGRKRNVDAEKPVMAGGSYVPLTEGHTAYGGSGAYPGNGAYAGHGDYGVNGDYSAPGAYGGNGYSQGITNGNARAGRNPEAAYEPYTHRR